MFPSSNKANIDPQKRQPRKIFAYQVGDVNGDGVPDQVYITGAQPYPDSPFIDNIALIVQDGRTSRQYSIPLQERAGFNPTLFLGDFTGDGVNDIQVAINSGGSGAFTYDYVFSFLNNRARKLFDFERFNEQYKYDIRYLDYYQVSVKSINGNSSYLIDIRNKGQEYLSEIYDENGKLKAPIEGAVSPLGGLYAVDFDRDGIYELLAYQRVYGRYRADGLGDLISVLKWDGKRFKQSLQWFGLFG
ncbi:VCBS repeat-containing protein [Heliorestis acidaminivorans]|uniref:VCBS repeat-containing protein n=1 Tax=Heliorestis acidaminivorans TaxID=553427 RepID=A0A6I0F9N4_9FIRM|nr:VCBS repeat-containing protein [Heliorestis acidaminivorans]KAB2954258.1 VCBS repeat-containing protein [Heliorestis acidaminivorans]